MSDESEAEPTIRGRRERSARYPGAPLPEAIELARFVDDHGLDGTSAEAIASSMGFESIKTRTFSARLSAARQFGLLSLSDSGYTLTPSARSILHPIDPDELPRMHREALKVPSLYADLIIRLADRKVPEPERLANLLYHSYQITTSAKLPAAEAFIESSRFAGMIDAEGHLRPDGVANRAAASVDRSGRDDADGEPRSGPDLARRLAPDRAPDAVSFDLRLWGVDEGKVIRVRAPESVTAESYDRLVRALRLHIRIDEGVPAGSPPPD